MRIGLISDTHDHLPSIQAALDRFAQLGVETLLHAGDVVAPFAAELLARFDGQLYITYGNNDGERRGLKSVLPQIQDGPLLVELGGKRVLLHHFVRWCREEDLAQADVVVTGHTHQPLVETRGGKLFVNPGECCGWMAGRSTVAVLDMPAREVTQIEISP